MEVYELFSDVGESRTEFADGSHKQAADCGARCREGASGLFRVSGTDLSRCPIEY